MQNKFESIYTLYGEVFSCFCCVKIINRFTCFLESKPVQQEVNRIVIHLQSN